MTTIQDAMSRAAELLEQANQNQITAHAFQIEATNLLKESVSARGFMAALATSQVPSEHNMQMALIESLKEGKALAYELIVKNVVMSSSAAKDHDKNKHAEHAALSRQTCANSVALAVLVNDVELSSMASAVQTAVKHWPERSEGEKLKHWYDFFERWHYTKEILQDSLTPLKSIEDKCASGATNND